MIDKNDNPEYLNDFLAYNATILNKSPNTVKEYNYDLAHFLKFIRLKERLHILVEKRFRGQLNQCDGCAICKR